MTLTDELKANSTQMNVQPEITTEDQQEQLVNHSNATPVQPQAGDNEIAE